MKYLFFLSAAVFVVNGALAQQAYPNRPIRLIVAFPPGGAADAFGRIIAPPLTETLQRQVIVENRPGAGTNIGAEIVAKSPPDGYTLFLGSISHAINVTLYNKLNYDFVKDFAPVTLATSIPLLVVVHPSVPVKSVKELIALAKARPGHLDYSSSGSGSVAHLAAAVFTSMADVKMNHVPYKGGGPAVISLIGGEVSVGFPTAPSVIQHVKSGKLKAIAVTGAQRSPFTPDLPTVNEAGLRGYDVVAWDGIVVPSGTPSEIISRLNAETVKSLKRQDVKERLDAVGLIPVGTTPDQFGAHIRSEITKWAKAVRESGARAD